MYPLFVIVPLLSVICLNLPLRRFMEKAAFWWLALVASCQAVLAASVILGFVDPDAFLPPLFTLRTDVLGAVVLLSAALVSVAALFAGGYVIKEKRRLFNFSNLLFIGLAGMNGVAISRDLFSLYMFIEITAVGSYILISLFKEKAALESAFKYIMLSSVASAMMLAAISLLLLIAGGTDFATVRNALAGSGNSFIIMCALALFICGLFIKGGQMPFHGWLPDVYSSAPAPVSVFLAGAVTKVLGAFVLMRLSFSAFELGAPVRSVIMSVGVLSIVAGALVALEQRDFKRMLAYSSISQIGYILAGLGSGSALGIAGAAAHLFNHSVFKSTLFINAAALESQAATRDINRLGGLGARMPVTAITSAIASLSAAGIPPLAGFWSKLLVVIALWTAGFRGYAIIAVAASVLTLAYLLVVQRKVFWGHLKEEFASVREAGFGLVFPACLLTAITVGLGLAFPFLLTLIKL